MLNVILATDAVAGSSPFTLNNLLVVEPETKFPAMSLNTIPVGAAAVVSRLKVLLEAAEVLPAVSISRTKTVWVPLAVVPKVKLVAPAVAAVQVLAVPSSRYSR